MKQLLTSKLTSPVYAENNAVFSIGRLHVDSDGSPRSYGSNNSGLDYTANAGSPGNWYGFVTHNGQPVVQGKNDPCPGMYVSTTSLEDPKFPSTDPRRYCNSEEVSFFVSPSPRAGLGLVMGDVAIVLNVHTKCYTAAVIGDYGNLREIGEGSIKLNLNLGIPAPKGLQDYVRRSGGADSGICYVLFPKTNKGWPRTEADVKDQANACFSEFGGFETLKAAYPEHDWTGYKQA